MNEPSSRAPVAAATGAHEIRQLEAEAGEARAALARLQRDVVDAEGRHSGADAAKLVEANEHLVVAFLRAQTDAETTARALEEMSRAAELDALTGLPNRLLLLDRFAHAIASAKRRNERLALLFLDLDDFKKINDTLGHAVGDQVLKRVAECLVSSIRESDTVSRYGGDEFLILLEVSHASDALLVADKVIAALRAPTRAGDHVLRLTVSIGVSIYPDDSENPDTLINLADAAMYRAKRRGLGGSVVHGDEPTRDRTRGAPPLESPHPTLTRYDQSLAEYERRHAQLREANEQLVLAALGAQEQESAVGKAQQRQTEFLAVLAHELRNPLAPIRTAAALMTGARTDGSLLPRLQAVIERQVAHLTRLVGDILDLSRVTTGKLTLQFGVVDMATVIDNALAASRPAMDAHRQRLRVQVPSCALEVRGDPVRLAQILNNLLDNASKYTPDGGEISVSAVAVDYTIVITVADSGIGIPAAALSGVFEPFVQGEQAIAFNGTGLGIGLTVVRELVEAHGGNVVASSAGTGLGSRFVVTLPACKVPRVLQYRVSKRSSPTVALLLGRARAATRRVSS